MGCTQVRGEKKKIVINVIKINKIKWGVYF